MINKLEVRKRVHVFPAVVGALVDARQIAAAAAHEVLRVELSRLLVGLADLVSTKVGSLHVQHRRTRISRVRVRVWWCACDGGKEGTLHL